ncbi:MAG: hypothetical protein ABIS20_25105 [Thermoanaerobaculia bacterium]
MIETLTEKASATQAGDREFLRRAGIAAELTPRLSATRKLLLALALLLMGSTAAFAGLFQANSPTAHDDYVADTTQCPM